MTVSRRDFLRSTTGATLALTSIPTLAYAQQPRIRRNIKGLTANSPEIKAMAKAIDAMRNLPDSDRRNWTNLAKVHGELNKFKTTNCKHGDWFFLPWHRAFLHSFELIVQELSGDQSFAVPYWAWEKDHQLPELFAKDGGIPAFDNPDRDNAPNSGRKNPQKFDPKDVHKHFSPRAINDLLAANFSLFAGCIEMREKEQVRLTGNLESGPHAFIHGWIDGDMLTGGAPIDPIFWLHHSNVDRFWDWWATKHPRGTPNEQSWLKGKLTGFCDGKGEKWETTVEAVLGDKLGYRYDNFQETAKMLPNDEWKVRVIPGMAPLKEAWRTDRGFCSADLKVGSKASDAFHAAVVVPKGERRFSVRMDLSGYKTDVDPRLALDVYLVPPGEIKPDSLTSDYPGFVGTAFLAQFASAEEGHHKPSHITLDATAAFHRLYPKQQIPKQDPFFRIVCIPFLIGGKKWDGKLEEILPVETGIDILEHRM